MPEHSDRGRGVRVSDRGVNRFTNQRAMVTVQWPYVTIRAKSWHAQNARCGMRHVAMVPGT
jgi:hypothetical protein